eukprot:307511-Pelagomonas_calceolata.AAC.1
MGIRRVTSSSPCLILVTKVERSFLKSAFGATNLSCIFESAFLTFYVSTGPRRPHHGCQGLSARETAVQLGCNHPPPEVLLRQGARADWIPEPDSVPAPSLDTMHSLVAEQIKKMNGSASPGFDEIAAPFYQRRCCFAAQTQQARKERHIANVPVAQRAVSLPDQKMRGELMWIGW